MNPKRPIKLVRKLFAKNIVFVSGSTRSGKSMLDPIISSLKQAELVQVNHLLEQFPMLNNLGLMTDEVAVYLLRYAVDFILYNIFIGRNVNFRLSDLSSVWKTHDPAEYFKRLLAEEGDCVLERISEADPMLVFNVHYGIWHKDIYFKAFPDLKMIHIRRHPVDVVYSWYKKGYGEDYAENPRNAILTVQGKTKPIPYLGIGWEDLYEKLSGVNRIIYLINRVQDIHESKIDSLSDEEKNKVMVIFFEKMVTGPKEVLKRICKFLNTEETLYTPIALEKERCPRVLKDEDRKEKFDELAKNAEGEYIDMLATMARDYEAMLKKE